MSKANDALSTPAPASKSRRAVILGAGGLAAAGALSTAALAVPIGSEPSPECARARALVGLLTAAGAALGDVPDDGPERDKVDDALSDHFDELIDVAPAMGAPVVSWADVAERAEIAGYFAEVETDDGLSCFSYFENGKLPIPPTVDDGDGDAAAQASIIHLIRAAMKMGGANV
jgi:hypothetical protein